MSRPNNTPALVGIAAFALGGMALLNKAQYENRPKTEEELRAEAAAANKTTGQPATETSKEAPVSTPPGTGDLLSRSADEYLGSTEPAHEVTLGYTLSPAVQGNMSQSADALQQFTQMLFRVNNQMSLRTRFRLVNIDVVRDAPAGVWVDNRYLAPFNLATLHTDGSRLIESIMGDVKTASPLPKKPSSVKKQG